MTKQVEALIAGAYLSGTNTRRVRRALLAAGQISTRKVDGWQTLADKPIAQCIDLAA